MDGLTLSSKHRSSMDNKKKTLIEIGNFEFLITYDLMRIIKIDLCFLLMSHSDSGPVWMWLIANDVKLLLMPIVYNRIIITNYEEKEEKNIVFLIVRELL